MRQLGDMEKLRPPWLFSSMTVFSASARLCTSSVQLQLTKVRPHDKKISIKKNYFRQKVPHLFYPSFRPNCKLCSPFFTVTRDAKVLSQKNMYGSPFYKTSAGLRFGRQKFFREDTWLLGTPVFYWPLGLSGVPESTRSLYTAVVSHVPASVPTFLFATFGNPHKIVLKLKPTWLIKMVIRK